MPQLDKTIGEEVKLICFADDGVICVEKDQRYYKKKKKTLDTKCAKSVAMLYTNRKLPIKQSSPISRGY